MITASLRALGVLSCLVLAGTALPGPSAAKDGADLAALAAPSPPPSFAKPDEAIAALKTALADNDLPATAKLLGLDPAKLGGDADVKQTFAEIRAAAAKQLTVQSLNRRQILQLGSKLWPLPFPLVEGKDGKWAFDTQAGLEEVRNRRIGENELQAIASVRAYVDAQNAYSDEDHDGDGVLEYAQKLISSPGATDGLYWPADQGDGVSPAGDLDQKELNDAAEGDGYFGYHFRILKGQGDNIDGGAYDYVINGNMIGGFALIAWPARYGETGVHTFAVNQQGTVYEIDFGPTTDLVVKQIERFNPDDDWDVVED